jgi:putative DNA primase/helicase
MPKVGVDDFLSAGGTIEELEALAEIYDVYGAYSDHYINTESLPNVVEFPVEAMPGACQRLVRQSAAAIGCPPDFVALPMLVVLGSAIGNSRVLKIKEGWTEGPAVYGATVAEPGEKKTSAAKVAMEPAVKAQAEYKSSFKEAKEQFESKLREHEKDKRACRKDGLADPIPPVAPVMKRTVVEDTTVEALAQVLEGNPRGVLAVRDELSGWARSMDQYKSGKGADRQFWLSAWSNSYASVDRKSREEPLILTRPLVGVFGSIQPEILSELGDGREDGLLDRFLFSYPDPIPSRWTDDEISPEAKAGYRKLYNDLRDLYMELDDHSDPNPQSVVFAPDAKDVFIDAVNTNREQMELPGFPGRLKGPYSKLEACLAKFCLILAVARCKESKEAERVEVRDVLQAVLLVDYFKTHARRVYVGLYGETPEDKFVKDLTSFLKAREGSFKGTPTELFSALESDYKPKTPKDLPRKIKELVKLSPLLEIIESTEAIRKEDGIRSTKRVVELKLKTNNAM